MGAWPKNARQTLSAGHDLSQEGAPAYAAGLPSPPWEIGTSLSGGMQDSQRLLLWDVVSALAPDVNGPRTTIFQELRADERGRVV